jgi:molecular chaperone GrpE (heat shock protein)
MLEGLLGTAIQVLRDRLAIFRLQRQVTRLKLRHFDHLAEAVVGLRRALETQRRAMDDLGVRLDEREAQIARLRDEYAALEARQSEQTTALLRDERISLFRQIQPLAIQLPTLWAALRAGADLSSHDVLEVVHPLEEALSRLGFEPIGDAGAEVPYDAQRHKLVGRGARAAGGDAVVRVRYVGYTYQGEVLCRAEVILAPQEESIS